MQVAKAVMSANFYDELLEGKECVVALHSNDIEAALVQFRLICRRSGKSIYHWNDAQGLQSMKASDISVPGSRKLADALRYVVQSMHYGVYVFSQFDRQLRHPCIQYLKKIAHLQDGYQRKVVLIGRHFSLPGLLADCVLHVVEDEHKSVQPRLRDGRWVV